MYRYICIYIYICVCTCMDAQAYLRRKFQQEQSSLSALQYLPLGTRVGPVCHSHVSKDSSLFLYIFEYKCMYHIYLSICIYM